MVHKNTAIRIEVLDNRIETDGYRSLVFKRPQDFEFEAGDWIDIQFLDIKLKGGKTYSLSSSPTEPQLMITFKDGISEIKRALAQVCAGDTLTIIQYGSDYKFTLKPHIPSVLIAGGVGVAPFRSMVKQMVDVGNRNDVVLIYLNQTPNFLFKAEIDEWAKQLPNFKPYYIVTGGLSRKDRLNKLREVIRTPRSYFCIAGPEVMVETTEHFLLDLGVSNSDIKIDSFGGY